MPSSLRCAPICGQSGSGSWIRLSGWRASPGRLARPTAYGKRVSSIYNAYIPGEGPYENIPEEHPPGWGATLSSLLGGKGGGLTSLLQKLGFGKVDSGDLLLMLILFLLWREGDQLDWVLLLGLALLFLRDSDP